MASGGQWTQARLASTKKFTDDFRCQLCLQSPGTLEHRYHCAATRPTQGWIKTNKDAEQLLAELPPDQRHLLITRGLLFCRIQQAPSAVADFRWVVHPPADIPTDARFYIDGSAFDPTIKSITKVGFAVVVVASSGQLLGVGLGLDSRFCWCRNVGTLHSAGIQRRRSLYRDGLPWSPHWD